MTDGQYYIIPKNKRLTAGIAYVLDGKIYNARLNRIKALEKGAVLQKTREIPWDIRLILEDKAEARKSAAKRVETKVAVVTKKLTPEEEYKRRREYYNSSQSDKGPRRNYVANHILDRIQIIA